MAITANMSSSSIARSGPVTIAGLATGVLAAKGLPADAATAAHVHEKALGVLRGFENTDVPQNMALDVGQHGCLPITDPVHMISAGEGPPFIQRNCSGIHARWRKLPGICLGAAWSGGRMASLYTRAVDRARLSKAVIGKLIRTP
jgi:hypothetical protein